MRSDDIIREVTEHLDGGGSVKLLIDKTGRRFVKLIKWRIFSTQHEINGATEATIQNLLIKRRQPRE